MVGQLVSGAAAASMRPGVVGQGEDVGLGRVAGNFAAGADDVARAGRQFRHSSMRMRILSGRLEDLDLAGFGGSFRARPGGNSEAVPLRSWAGSILL